MLPQALGSSGWTAGIFRLRHIDESVQHAVHGLQDVRQQAMPKGD